MKNNYDFEEYYFTNYESKYTIDEILEYFNDERITTIIIPINSDSHLLSNVSKIRKHKKSVHASNKKQNRL